MKKVTHPLLIAIFIIVLLGESLLAQHSSLNIFAPLAGKTWIANGQWANGSPYRAKIHFEYALNNTIVIASTEGFTDNEQNKFGPRNHGIRQYDPETKTIRFWEFDVFGGRTEGTVFARGDDLFYQYDYNNTLVTDHWEKVDDHTYNFKVGQYDDGKWTAVYLDTQFKAQESGVGESRFSTLDQHLQQYISKGKLPGLSALVIQGGQVVYQTHKGYSDVERQLKVDDNTRFRLASLTKSVTSMAILHLVDSGKIKLGDPVARYLPAFKNLSVFGSNNKAGADILIEHLLSHTSGISSAFYDDEVGKRFGQTLKPSYENLSDLIDDVATIPLAVEPGKSFRYGYSNDVLARVVEVVTGQPFGEYLRQNILEPLDMHSTGFSVSPENMPHLATLYNIDEEGNLKPISSTESYNVFPRGNSGLVSTISDFSKFCQMLLNKGKYNGRQLIREALFEKFATNYLPSEALPIAIGKLKLPDMGFGLGPGVALAPNAMGRIPGSFGWVGASHTCYFVDPQNEVIGILFSHFANVNQSPLIFEFNAKVYDCLEVE